MLVNWTNKQNKHLFDTVVVTGGSKLTVKPVTKGGFFNTGKTCRLRRFTDKECINVLNALHCSWRRLMTQKWRRLLLFLFYRFNTELKWCLFTGANNVKRFTELWLWWRLRASTRCLRKLSSC